jgi:outer membrane protein TolC
VEALVQEALALRPELREGSSLVAAEQERIPQAGALPDPVLTLGLQNDSFTEYSIGKAETSWYTVMLTQAFPFPGKLAQRAEVAGVEPKLATASLRRRRLSIEAEVRRGYVELLLVRDQLRLLGKTEELWRKSAAVAKARYSVGEVPQSDLLRAQLELTRLRQQRLALEGTERVRLEALNRSRARALSEPIPTDSSLERLGGPVVPSSEAALRDAEDRSPELVELRLTEEQSGRKLKLARTERLPDFSLGAGVMPRGSLVPMWQVVLGVTLPVYAGSKQNRAVAEAQAREKAAVEGKEALVQTLRLRTEQRLSLLDAVTRANALYRDALLIQSEATATSTLSEYQVGKVPFTAVLEALGGYLADEGGYLESLAQAHQLSIAQLELSLEEPTGAAPGIARLVSVGRASAAAAPTGMAPAPGAQTEPQAQPTSSGMGGM